MPRAELPCEQTAFAGIHRILPGHLVGFLPGGQVVNYAAWSWADEIAPSGPIGREEAGRQLAQLFQQAVQQRIKSGPVAAHLSGGMDSSAVAAVASELLAAGAGTKPLHTLSLVYTRPSLAGERRFIDLVLAQGGAVQPHWLAGDNLLEFDWFDRGIPSHDEPFACLRSLPMLRAFTEAADQVGALTTLSGWGADEVLDCSPLHLADQIRQGRWLAAWKESRLWAQAWSQGIWSVLISFGIEPLAPVLWRDGLWRWLCGANPPWPRAGWFSVPPWITPAFSRSHQLRQRAHEYARRQSGRPIVWAMDRTMLEISTGDWARWHLAAPRGLNTSHPFRDPRLVCFTLGLPFAVRAEPGKRKPLLQEALRGVLPEPIRTRREKCGFDNIYGLGLAKNLPRLKRMVRTSAIADLGILDPEQLLAAMQQAALGRGDVQAREQIDRTLALIAWLDQVMGSSRHNPAGVSLAGTAGFAATTSSCREPYVRGDV
jgi:asparagine synthase (glutamine-hydrolysing)